MEDSKTTIDRMLSRYELGAKLRRLRLRKKLGLAELGRHTGLSASLISQLENGKLVPTLATLARIAMVFDIGLEHFFTEPGKRRPLSVVRAEERYRFPDRPGSPKPVYFFECLAFAFQDKSLQAYLAEFPRRSEGEMEDHYHEGAEFIYVLDGILVVHYNGEDHQLNPGDTVYFDSTQPHSYRGTSRAPAHAVVVTAPPRP